jgi:hypothetical protein
VADVQPDHSAALRLLLERQRRLEVADHVHERAAAVLKADGVPGMDERRLFADWKNDIICDRERATFREAAADPAASYLGYVEGRIAEPYHVSYRAVRALAKQVDEDEANTFVHVRWHQELAWARRFRAGADDRVAVLSQLFLRAAAKDPCKAFADLATAWATAIDEIRFSTAPEHDLSESAIRALPGEVSYRPAFLRLYEIKHGSVLDQMKDGNLLAAAAQARSAEEADRRGDLAAGSVAAARRSPLSRLPGVISVAAETGRGSNALVRDERRFLSDLSRGRWPKVVRGLPYSEFLDWLRTTPPEPEPAPVAIGDDEHLALTRLLAAPMSWLNNLPEAYRELDSHDVDTFREWAFPLSAGTAPVPLDAVADYGFHLVRKAYRRPR